MCSAPSWWRGSAPARATHLERLLEAASFSAAGLQASARRSARTPTPASCWSSGSGLSQWLARAAEGEGRSARPAVHAYAEKLLSKRHHKARKLGRGFCPPPAPERHECGSREKAPLRLRAFEDLFPAQGQQALLASLEQTQDSLAISTTLRSPSRGRPPGRPAAAQTERESLHMAAGLV